MRKNGTCVRHVRVTAGGNDGGRLRIDVAFDIFAQKSRNGPRTRSKAEIPALRTAACVPQRIVCFNVD